jgi:hypothetical protein
METTLTLIFQLKSIISNLKEEYLTVKKFMQTE